MGWRQTFYKTNYYMQSWSTYTPHSHRTSCVRPMWPMCMCVDIYFMCFDTQSYVSFNRSNTMSRRNNNKKLRVNFTFLCDANDRKIFAEILNYGWNGSVCLLCMWAMGISLLFFIAYRFIIYLFIYLLRHTEKSIFLYYYSIGTYLQYNDDDDDGWWWKFICYVTLC